MAQISWITYREHFHESHANDDSCESAPLREKELQASVEFNFLFSLEREREEKKIRLIFYRFILFQNNSCAASFCWGEFVLNRIYVRRIWDMELLFFRRWNNCKYLFANYVLMWNKFSPNSILREWDMRRTFGAGHKKKPRMLANWKDIRTRYIHCRAYICLCIEMGMTPPQWMKSNVANRYILSRWNFVEKEHSKRKHSPNTPINLSLLVSKRSVSSFSVWFSLN